MTSGESGCVLGPNKRDDLFERLKANPVVFVLGVVVAVMVAFEAGVFITQTVPWLSSFLDPLAGVLTPLVDWMVTGKRMRVEGRFGDATALTPELVRVSFELSSLPSYHYLHMWGRDKRWADSVATLRIGQQIVVRGRIDAVSAIDIKLEDCEIVEGPCPVEWWEMSDPS